MDLEGVDLPSYELLPVQRYDPERSPLFFIPRRAPALLGPRSLPARSPVPDQRPVSVPLRKHLLPGVKSLVR